MWSSTWERHLAPNPKDCFPVFSTNSKVLEEFTDKTGTLIIVDEVSFG